MTPLAVPPVPPRLSPAPGASRFGPPDAPAQTGEYSILGLARDADELSVRRRARGLTVALFVAATAVAMLYSLERYVYSRLVHQPVSLARVVPLEVISAYLWALMAPAVMWCARRYPVWGGGAAQRRTRHWLVQLGAMLVFVFLHSSFLLLAATVLGTTSGSASVRALFEQQLVSWSVLDTIVFAMLVAVQHAIVYSGVSRDRALRASQLEAHLAQAQLQVLRMQLQPHFLFNTLHSISALMHRDVDRADSMIAALSDLLRMSLQQLGAQEVALQVELDFLQRYAEIMRMRFGDRLAVAIDVQPETRDARVPTLLLQPLVENAFRHGLGEQVGRGAIRVTVDRRGDMLHCEVSDDGKGFPPGHREGVGLTSTRQRLAHLYGERHTFAIRSAAGEGARVVLEIPFQSGK